MKEALIALVSAAAAGTLVWVLFTRRQEKRLTFLCGQLDAFLNGKLTTPAFSVEDDRDALLENRVVELETRLLDTRDRLDRNLRHNVDFIADISHQLKTPLAGIKLYCEMDASPHGDRQLALIEHIEELIQALLRLERLQSDGYRLRFAPSDLSAIASRAKDTVAALFPDRTIAIEGEAELRCDAYWINEALMNLFKNACEHTPSGKLIRVRIQRGEASVTVTVEDEGEGVPEERLHTLFHRFSQVRAVGSGTGLGLAITRAIIEKHHGSITAENTGTGLRVTLCLPYLDGILAIS